ncbi:MAG: FAD:protein FMN transferase [Pseudomonadota bacterium]
MATQSQRVASGWLAPLVFTSRDGRRRARRQRRLCGVIALAALGLVAACDASLVGGAPHVVEVAGETMGTYYSVALVAGRGEAPSASALRELVEQSLLPITTQLSNWSEDSEVSRFNAHSHTDPVAISDELSEVMQVASVVHERSLGAFDVTVAPLIELWGFGADGQDARAVPPESAIAEALEAVGQARGLELGQDPATLRKRRPETSVQLAALAKGYGIDKVARALRERGWRDFMVEIGGDLYTSGTNREGTAWRIGVERPVAGQRSVHQIIDVSDVGLATSGDYRNYFERDGVRYSHIIDATTGRPVTHTTASVTVIAESAILADAWATALLALGQERGMPVAERWGLAALFVSREGTAEQPNFVTQASERFAELQPE